MKNDINKIWLSAVEMMTKHPVIIMPFVVVAFMEGLVLELLYFSTRKPISLVLNPIVSKFFGRGYLHYPAHLVLLPKLFYFAQVIIYVLIGVFLTAIAVNMFKKINEGGTIKLRPLVKSAANRYAAFLVFGIVSVVLLALIQKFDTYVFGKVSRLIARNFKDLPMFVYSGLYLIGNFFMYVILQIFLVFTIPVMVIEKKSFLAAFFKSVSMGLRNFFSILMIILLPYLLYVPVIALKSEPINVINRTFPEITVVITLVGILLALFLECFVILCASQFLLDKEKSVVKAT